MKNKEIRIETENMEFLDTEEFTPEQYKKAYSFAYGYLIAFDCLVKDQSLELDTIVNRMEELLMHVMGDINIMEEDPEHDPKPHWMVDYFQLRMKAEYYEDVIELLQKQLKESEAKLKTYEKGTKDTKVELSSSKGKKVAKTSNPKPENKK